MKHSLKRNDTTNPEAVKTAAYEISDETAAIKAKRLMNRLSKHATPENFLKTSERYGLRKGASPTKQWQAVLKMAMRRDDVIACLYDAKMRRLEKPDPKRTKEVVMFLLAQADGFVTDDEGERQADGLYLGYLSFPRSAMLNPERTSAEDIGALYVMMRVTLHALQRLIQRGHAISKDGEISYQDLLTILLNVGCEAKNRMEQQSEFPATVKVESIGTQFVVKQNTPDGAMALLTMLPPDYQKSP